MQFRLCGAESQVLHQNLTGSFRVYSLGSVKETEQRSSSPVCCSDQKSEGCSSNWENHSKHRTDGKETLVGGTVCGETGSEP